MAEATNEDYKHKTWMYEIYNDKWMFLYGQFLATVNSNIKLLFIVNSGTIISLLTFAGHQHNLELFHKLRVSFWILAVGVSSSVLCSISEMRRQDIALGNFRKEWENHFKDPALKNEKPATANTCAHRVYNLFAWFFGIISFTSFIAGTAISVYILSSS